MNASVLTITGDNVEVSDGFHSISELYAHRIALFIALCKVLDNEFVPVWKSHRHSDGSSFDGWFVMGIRQVKGKQITYHLPISAWHECAFAQTLETAPEFDGHTPQDVLVRLRSILALV